jgi:pimeloyl-ACP methyl ester carboxylesterase
MSRIQRLIRSFFRLVLPVAILVILAVLAGGIWLVHTSSQPPKAAYLVTPEKYGQLSTRGAKVTDEKWTNRDGSPARGWLLRGRENAPAVVLLHRYGADRSHVLNLGVKLNEATDFTILMPDIRGHGENPLVKETTFGGNETEDVMAALDFLRSLKTENKNALVGGEIALYGVELGALAGLKAAAKDANVKVLVLDSVPLHSDEVLGAAIGRRFPFASSYTSKIAALGTYPYFFNRGYDYDSLCDTAKAVGDRKIMLLAGVDAPRLQDSTQTLIGCFNNSAGVQTYTGLAPSGYNLTNASLEQADAYDQRVIDFFKRSLSSEETRVQTAKN